MTAPKTKRKHLKVAGQVKYTSMNDALRAVSDTMNQLHIETHQRSLNERKRG